MDLDRVLVTARELRIAAQVQGDSDGVARVTTALLGDLADLLTGLRDDLTEARAQLTATVAIRESDRKTSDLLGEALDGFLNVTEKYGIKREPLDLATPEGLSRSLARDCGVMRSLTGVLDEQLTEARAEIAALRGLPEGAVSGGWDAHLVSFGQCCFRWQKDVGAYGRMCAQIATDGSILWRVIERGIATTTGTAPTLRDAMRAADKAAGVAS